MFFLQVLDWNQTAAWTAWKFKNLKYYKQVLKMIGIDVQYTYITYIDIILIDRYGPLKM